jgi:hypothetical protein
MLYLLCNLVFWFKIIRFEENLSVYFMIRFNYLYFSKIYISEPPSNVALHSYICIMTVKCKITWWLESCWCWEGVCSTTMIGGRICCSRSRRFWYSRSLSAFSLSRSRKTCSYQISQNDEYFKRFPESKTKIFPSLTHAIYL